MSLILIEFFISLGLDPTTRPGRFWGLGAHSFEELRTGLQATCQRVVPFGKLRINSKLTMSGGHSRGLLEREDIRPIQQASLDSRA